MREVQFASVEELPKKDANRVHPLQPEVQRTNAAEVAQPNPASGSVANDGIDRRNFLSCMAWTGTGLLWTMAGGVPTSKLFAATPGVGGEQATHTGSGFSFVQISDRSVSNPVFRLPGVRQALTGSSVRLGDATTGADPWLHLNRGCPHQSAQILSESPFGSDHLTTSSTKMPRAAASVPALAKAPA